MNTSVVVLSGSLSRGSASNRLATWCAQQCAPHIDATVFHGYQLEFPFYTPGGWDRRQSTCTWMHSALPTVSS